MKCIQSSQTPVANQVDRFIWSGSVMTILYFPSLFSNQKHLMASKADLINRKKALSIYLLLALSLTSV